MFMAIFEVEPIPKITIKPMTVGDGFRYHYYELGDTESAAKLRLVSRLRKDAETLSGLAKTYNEAASKLVTELDSEAGQ